jgi:hypothetical protein
MSHRRIIAALRNSNRRGRCEDALQRPGSSFAAALNRKVARDFRICQIAAIVSALLDADAIAPEVLTQMITLSGQTQLRLDVWPNSAESASCHGGRDRRSRPEPKNREKGNVLLHWAVRGQAHFAVLGSPKVLSRSALESRGSTAKRGNGGCYAQVIEGRCHPHLEADAFARRIAGTARRMPPKQVIPRHVRELGANRSAELKAYRCLATEASVMAMLI